MQPVHLRFSPAAAFVALYGGVPVVGFTVTLLAWRMWLVLEDPGAFEPEVRFVMAALVPVEALFIYIGVSLLRARHALFTHYVLDDRGITVSYKSEPPAVVSWSAVESGHFSRLGQILTLHVPQLPRPLVMLNTSSQDVSSEWLAARDAAFSRLGERIELRWL